jgi:hypothetical protein
MPIPGKTYLSQIQDDESGLLQSSSALSYNKVLMAEVIVKSYDTRNIDTEDGAQRLVTEHTVEVEAIVHPAMNQYYEDGFGDIHRAPAFDRTIFNSAALLHKHLMQERGELYLLIAGRLVLSAPVTGFTCDAMMGPKPQRCEVTRVTGTSSFYVKFTIKTWIDNCSYLSGGRFIRAHRWTCSHDVDGSTWLTTRAVQGTVQFRPEVLVQKDKAPDQVADPNFIHPLPRGFVRENVKVIAAADGMNIAYSFVDREVALPLGSLNPATRLKAEFSFASELNVTDKSNLMTSAMVHVSAVGPKDQLRPNLLTVALRVALAKLSRDRGRLFVYSFQATYSLDEVLIDVTIRAIWKPVAEGVKVGEADGFNIDVRPLRDGDKTDLDDALAPWKGVGEGKQGSQPHQAKNPISPLDGRRGTWMGYCVGSAIVDGCYLHQQPRNHLLEEAVFEGGPGASNPTDILQSITNTNGPVSFDLRVVAELEIETASTGYSAESTNGDGWYQTWEQNTRYETRHLKALLPVGYVQGASPGSTDYTPPQVATLGVPYTTMTVVCTVGWVGPSASGVILPSPDIDTNNYTLLRDEVQPATPVIINSLLRGWRFTTTYYYVCKKLRTASEVARSQFAGTDYGLAIGTSVNDPYVQESVGFDNFETGYVPESTA